MRALTIMLAAACLFGLVRAASLTFLHVPLDPNEGWNAYHAVAAMTGAPLYPDGMFTNNYPPLSFYVAGLFGGDRIVAGRIVALLSLLAVAGGIVLAARRMGTSTTDAVFAALWFLGGMLVFTDYVAMDDPQLLGHAVQIAGLLLLLRGNVVAAALAMAAALFVKHNLVALPLASLLWLALTDRRSALRFAATGIAAGVAGLLLFDLVYGKSLLGVLRSPRLYTFGAGVEPWLAWGGTAMLATAALGLVDRSFAAVYALVAVLLGAFFSGGAGVDMNAWFDAAIACALGAALALEGLPGRAWHRYALAAVLIVPLAAGVALHDDWPGRDDAADADIAFLESHDGPALCEMLSLCYWAGKPATVDVFNLGQAYATGAARDDALAARLQAREFASIEFDSLDDFALTPRVKSVLLANYSVDHRDDTGVFLVPRPVRRSRP
ncbi:MAG TPA: hypothetical protein VG889_21780 [Rhizomicrobium sp.]|nr:hypothetical protein [Rhizomicrobium sp.]